MQVVVVWVWLGMAIVWWDWFPVFIRGEGVRNVVRVCIMGVRCEHYIVGFSLAGSWVWGVSSYNAGFATFGIVVMMRKGFVGAGGIVAHVEQWKSTTV